MALSKLTFVPFLLTCSLVPLIWLIAPSSPRLDSSELSSTPGLLLPADLLAGQVRSVPPLRCLHFHLLLLFPRCAFTQPQVTHPRQMPTPNSLSSLQGSVSCTQPTPMRFTRSFSKVSADLKSFASDPRSNTFSLFQILLSKRSSPLSSTFVALSSYSLITPSR